MLTTSYVDPPAARSKKWRTFAVIVAHIWRSGQLESMRWAPTLRMESSIRPFISHDAGLVPPLFLTLLPPSHPPVACRSRKLFLLQHLLLQNLLRHLLSNISDLFASTFTQLPVTAPALSLASSIAASRHPDPDLQTSHKNFYHFYPLRCPEAKSSS